MMWRSLGALVLAVTAAAIAGAPVLLQNPFGEQSPASMTIAHTARIWGPVLTIGCALAAIALAWPVARRGRWWARALLVVPVAIAVGAVWFARQNPFEWMFNGLPQPHYVSIAEASFVEPGDLVLAVAQDGDAVAFPVRLIAYHHIVNDRIGRTPAVVTY